MASYSSSIIQQVENTNELETNHEDEKMSDKYESKTNFQRAQYQFELDVDIRKTEQEPIFQEFGKSIYEVEWINRDGLPIILLEIDGAKAKKEASFYLQLSSHPHIVRMYGLVRSNPGSIALLQECAPQGNLSELLRENEFKPCERVLWEIFKQICDAMIFLAKNSIIHGDLACRNVLIFQMNPVNPKKNLVKLTDFGLTRVSKLYSVIDSSALTIMTTVPTRYAAPELLENSKKLDYSEKSDVYSMGVLMWEACSYGKLPYSNINDNETIRQQKLNDEKLPQPSLCSNQLWTIINDCWEQKPGNRPDFLSLKQAISNLQAKSIVKSESTTVPDVSPDTSIISSQLNKADNLRYVGYEDYSEQDDDTKPLEAHNERFYSDKSLDSHETRDFQDKSTSCPFCQEHLLSSTDARDHLLQCGTKTDQCPNCQKFIQRAIFAYHYENNCANINDIDISNRLNNPHPRRSSRFSSFHSNERTQSATSNTHNSSEVVECEFCHHQCKQNDYETHKNYCLRNPAKARSLIHKRYSSNESVVVPCKYCHEQYPEGQLHLHKKSCLKNPDRSFHTRSTQKHPSASQSVRPTPLSEPNEDTTSILVNEAPNFPARDPQSSSVNNDTEGNPSGCCCCS